MAMNTDLIYCPICLDVFISPRALPCLHTFCELCLHEYIQAAAGSHRAGTSFNGFDCPTCRQNVPAPSTEPRDKWAGRFVLNHMMVTLIDERKARDPTVKSQLDEKGKVVPSEHKRELVEAPPTWEAPIKPQKEAATVEDPNAPTTEWTGQYGDGPPHFPPCHRGPRGHGPPGWRHPHRPPHHWPPPHGPPPHGQPPHWPPPHGQPPHGPPHHRPPHHGPRHPHGPHSGRPHRGRCHRPPHF